MPAPARWRRFHLGLRTLVGARPGGFFVPYRHAGAISPTGYPALEPLFAASLPAMVGWLARIEALADRLRALEGPPPAPRWNQDWFPRLDGAALYAFVRTAMPRRILEVGSGHSTRFIAQAVADGGFPCAVTCVDPQPRADLGRLPVELRRRLFGAADAELADELGPGDILLVDSSHVAMPGSDVDLLLNRVLPRLRPGVLIHLHDIFLPDAYPADWAWRGYNEQGAVAAMLAGGGWDILFARRFARQRFEMRLREGPLGAYHDAAGPATSLWLAKR